MPLFIKRISFVCCLLFSLCIAQSAAGQQRKIDKANEKLGAMLDYLQSLNSLEVLFTLEINDASNKKIASQTGVVKVKKNSYELELGDQTIYSDGATMWIYNKALNEVQITNSSKDANNLLDIQTLFTGKLKKSQFSSKFNDNININNKKCDEIEMTPIDKTKPYFKILLWVDNKKHTIEKAKIFDKTGAKYIYTTKKMKKDVALEKNFGKFLLAAHPSVEVVDMR